MQGGTGIALVEARAAARFADDVAQPFSVGMAALGPGVTHHLRGDFERAHSVRKRGLAIAEERKIEWWLAVLAWQLGHGATLSGQTDRAVPRLVQALERFGHRSIGAYRTLAVANPGEACLHSGDAEGAIGIGRDALNGARQAGERG